MRIAPDSERRSLAEFGRWATGLGLMVFSAAAALAGLFIGYLVAAVVTTTSDLLFSRPLDDGPLLGFEWAYAALVALIVGREIHFLVTRSRRSLNAYAGPLSLLTAAALLVLYAVLIAPRFDWISLIVGYVAGAFAGAVQWRMANPMHGL